MAHSKGGLIGKSAMLDAVLCPDISLKYDAGTPVPAPPAPVEVLGLVAVATPFSGSPYAKYLLSRTLRDFSPVDAVLLALQADTALNHKIVSIYPEFDPTSPVGVRWPERSTLSCPSQVISARSTMKPSWTP
ncbi:hypothetical protein NHF46_24675 [Arthrobacter alpinus]|nr:hypothetical protein [Arthrobacter alpinus]